MIDQAAEPAKRTRRGKKKADGTEAAVVAAPVAAAEVAEVVEEVAPVTEAPAEEATDKAAE